MTYRWLDGATVVRLLNDLTCAESGDFGSVPVHESPILRNYKPVIGKALALSGTVSGHPRVADGREVITSQLFYLDEERGLARTMNRWYRLCSGVRNQGH
ncbi:DUF6634 family protein [Rhizobium ruizarguesonis]|uniref:DUF6634 family protein n=1 Tax=Rhizobium ruizarguesonis TaxID=2081791 RepID=UPI001031332B|nr:DUF6634 family protein [Rhizobium ruizarguesonis]TAZ42070.1 hypothetical protein ELH74_22935 [Rhizobium ruizarguesonis]TBA06381.1 hypothetical protein ELH64_18930 [Rhizobium ruizarguesonis]